MNKTSEWFKKVKKTTKQLVSPLFLFLFVLAAIFWYLTKLSYTYTATIPINIDLEGNRFRVECLAEGTGYRIMAHRMFIRKYLDIKSGDVELTPAAGSWESYIVKPFSLQTALSRRYADIKIISVGEIPEVNLSK